MWLAHYLSLRLFPLLVVVVHSRALRMLGSWLTTQVYGSRAASVADLWPTLELNTDRDSPISTTHVQSAKSQFSKKHPLS